MMRRLLEALLLVLGFSWGLAPFSFPASPATSGQGLGVERTYLEGSSNAHHAFFAPPLLVAGLLRWRWRFRHGGRPVFAEPWLPQRRLFLRLGRLQLEGG
ncbi:hypothetical protein [Oceanithermus sp.]